MLKYPEKSLGRIVFQMYIAISIVIVIVGQDHAEMGKNQTSPGHVPRADQDMPDGLLVNALTEEVKDGALRPVYHQGKE